MSESLSTRHDARAALCDNLVYAHLNRLEYICLWLLSMSTHSCAVGIAQRYHNRSLLSSSLTTDIYVYYFSWDFLRMAAFNVPFITDKQQKHIAKFWQSMSAALRKGLRTILRQSDFLVAPTVGLGLKIN